jgi:hypothetical protein
MSSYVGTSLLGLGEFMIRKLPIVKHGAARRGTVHGPCLPPPALQPGRRPPSPPSIRGAHGTRPLARPATIMLSRTQCSLLGGQAGQRGRVSRQRGCALVPRVRAYPAPAARRVRVWLHHRPDDTAAGAQRQDVAACLPAHCPVHCGAGWWDVARSPQPTAPECAWNCCCLVQTTGGELVLYAVYVPTNHVYIGDIFLMGESEIIRNNLSVREGLGQCGRRVGGSSGAGRQALPGARGNGSRRCGEGAAPGGCHRSVILSST